MSKNRVLTLFLIGLLTLTFSTGQNVQATNSDKMHTMDQTADPLADATLTATLDQMNNADLDNLIGELMAIEAPTQKDEHALQIAISVRSRNNHNDELDFFWSSIDKNQKHWINIIDKTNYSINTKNDIKETLNNKLAERKETYDNNIDIVTALFIALCIPVVSGIVVYTVKKIKKKEQTKLD